MEGAAPQSESGRVGRSHCLLEISRSLGVHDPPDIGGTGTLQQLHGGGDVLRPELTVSVDPHDDVVRAGRHSQVHGLGRRALRVRDDPNPLVAVDKPLSDPFGVVLAGCDDENDLHRPRVALTDDSGDGGRQKSLLVAHRHDDGHRRCEIGGHVVHCASFTMNVRGDDPVQPGTQGSSCPTPASTLTVLALRSHGPGTGATVLTLRQQRRTPSL